MTNNNRRDDVDLYPTAAPPPSRPRAAVAKKDRHSKICTAGGMRDRRMCLSLGVARRFFSLQDKLGFDKASKTVQWLLDHVMVADAEKNNCKIKGRRRAGRKGSNGAPALLPDKESRARARQRARERTVERNRLRSSSASTFAAAANEAPAPVPAPARQVILPMIPSFGSYYEEQEPWELGGVVFAKPRLHY